MKQKKIFAHRKERHPIKWTLIFVGLISLSFVSFSAGVHFGQLELEVDDRTYAEKTSAAPNGVSHKLNFSEEL